MAFTDRSDLFAAVHENGINATIGQLMVENLTAEMEAAVAASILPGQPSAGPATGPSAGGGVQPAPDDRSGRAAAAVQPVPSTNVICTCLELFGVGHFQGGTIGGDPQQWLKVRLDGLEVVDLVPSNLEDIVECYLRLVLRLGVLPRLIVPMESLVLDITRMLQDNGTAIGQHVTLVPAAVPAEVPANPAVEDDQLKVCELAEVVVPIQHLTATVSDVELVVTADIGAGS